MSQRAIFTDEKPKAKKKQIENRKIQFNTRSGERKRKKNQWVFFSFVFVSFFRCFSSKLNGAQKFQQSSIGLIDNDMTGGAVGAMWAMRIFGETWKCQRRAMKGKRGREERRRTKIVISKSVTIFIYYPIKEFVLFDDKVWSSPDAPFASGRGVTTTTRRFQLWIPVRKDAHSLTDKHLQHSHTDTSNYDRCISNAIIPLR